MKRLTLVRHAKSSWAAPAAADRDRPLSNRGERDSRKMGRRLVAHKARPSLIVTSPALRAQATAKALAAALSYPLEFLQVEDDLYLAAPSNLLDVAQKQQDDYSDLLIVGHNPGLTDLVNQLLSDMHLDNLPTGAVVAMDFDTDAWSQIHACPARLAYYDYPKNPEVLLIED